MRGRVVLADILESDRNSFNLVRLTAALAVLVSHSYSVPAGTAAVEPLATASAFTLGQHAVNAFFVISGLTLSQSLARKSDLVHYAWARMLRIVPALLMFGFVFAFIAGPLLTAMPLQGYFADLHTWLYPASVTVKFANAPPPPDIFSGLPYAGAANNPLWTIKYELMAYVGLAAFSWLRLRGLSLFGIILLAAGTMVLVGVPSDSETSGAWLYHISRYGFCFLLGMTAYHLRLQLSLSPLLLILPLALAFALKGTTLEDVADIVLVGHLVLILGGRSYGIFTTLSRKDDISYGIYIYGWPVQQALVMWLTPAVSTILLMALTFLIVPWFALASWHFVEKPALQLKRIDPRHLLWRFRTRREQTI